MKLAKTVALFVALLLVTTAQAFRPDDRHQP